MNKNKNNDFFDETLFGQKNLDVVEPYTLLCKKCGEEKNSKFAQYCKSCGEKISEPGSGEVIGVRRCINCHKEYKDNSILFCEIDGNEVVEQKLSMNQVKVTDIDMPMSSMILFIIKWISASIPAMIILGIIFVFFYFILLGLGAVLF